MKKKSISFKDLTKRELECIKDLYVQEKVGSMSNEELKEFAKDNINHQITQTIGDEEEKEAWREITNFFGDSIDELVKKIKKKYESYPESIALEQNDYEKRLELLKNNQIEDEKTDMW